MMFQLEQGPPKTTRQILDEEINLKASGLGAISDLHDAKCLQDLVKKGYIDTARDAPILQQWPAPTPYIDGTLIPPSVAEHALAGRVFVNLDLNHPAFKPSYEAEGKPGVDCVNASCTGHGRYNTDAKRVCIAATMYGGKMYVIYSTSVCDTCGNKIPHKSRTSLLNAPAAVSQRYRQLGIDAAAMVDGSNVCLAGSGLNGAVFSLRVGAGAEQIAAALNASERDAAVVAARIHVDNVNRWWTDVERVAGDIAWNKLDLNERKDPKVYGARVAYQRCRSLKDRSVGVMRLLEASSGNVTADQVINSFLAWAEDRRLPNLRFMNATVTVLAIKDDHCKTVGDLLNGVWGFNLLASPHSAALGHKLTQTTSIKEVAPWLNVIGKRPGMKPLARISDNWLISREKYVEQLHVVEAGGEPDFGDTLFDTVWKIAFPSLKWQYTDRFHITKNFKLGVPHIACHLVYEIFAVGPRKCLGGFDPVVQGKLEDMMRSGTVKVKEFTHLGKKRSCSLQQPKTQDEIDEWVEDGSLWEAFGTGSCKVLGLKARRYDEIETMVDALHAAAKEAFFWPGDAPKRFVKDGKLLTLLPEGTHPPTSVTIVSTVGALDNRFDNFKKRAIMAGRVENIGLPEHVPVSPPRFRNGLPVIKALLNTCDVEARNSTQQNWTAGPSGNDDLKTAIAYEASSHDQRVLLDKHGDPVKTNNWPDAMHLNACAEANMPACVVPVVKLAADYTNG
jgi:hypothetical protein